MLPRITVSLQISGQVYMPLLDCRSVYARFCINLPFIVWWLSVLPVQEANLVYQA